MRSLLDNENQEGERGEGGRHSELDPCLARVRREQNVAAKTARFGAHLTKIVKFSAKPKPNLKEVHYRRELISRLGKPAHYGRPWGVDFG